MYITVIIINCILKYTTHSTRVPTKESSRFVNRLQHWRDCHLGGVMVSVLATGSKGCGFEPGQDDGFFKGDKNPQHTFPSDGK
jgi:hypothetical protein